MLPMKCTVGPCLNWKMKKEKDFYCTSEKN